MSYSSLEKKVQTEFTKDQIVAAIKSIPAHLPNVKMPITREDFGYYVLTTDANGVNLGAILEISLLVEGQYTNVHLACRRKVDFINHRWEYDDCQAVMDSCLSLISRSIKGELKKE